MTRAARRADERRKPLLYLDIDGPLNPYAAMPDHLPTGYQEHHLMPPRWEAMERARLETWDRPGAQPRPLPVWLDPTHGAQLSALPYELVWASTWEEDANGFVAPLIGLPPLPWITWEGTLIGEPGPLFWKTPEVVAAAAGRPFAWIDDEVTTADETWVAVHHPAPALLLRIDPGVGLREPDLDRLRSWAAGLR
ncbi:hypothetical protein ABH940_007370 [Streptacidiphilus sp. BW17]